GPHPTSFVTVPLKKGPPVPPPPKVTPTKEVAEEQIIDLFGGEFLPAPSPSQPNERPGESLLDLDFDAFQPDDSVSPIPQTAVPWDMWSANSQPAQPAADAGFTADWSADFGSMSANGDVASAAVPIASEMPEGQQVGVQGGAQCWPQAESSTPGGDTTSVQDSEPRRKEDEDVAAPSFFTDFDKLNEVESEKTEVPEASQKQAADKHNKATAPHGGGEQCTNPSIAAGEDTEHQPVEAKIEEMPAPPAGEVREHEAGSDVEEEKEKSLDTLHEEEQAIKAGIPEEEPPEVPQADETKSCEGESAPSERMPIPSVVIEPASSNEGDDDRDADIISPTSVSDNSVTSQSNTLKHMIPSGGGSGFPDDFLYKVETMHDFEAANSDELELKRGDVVLVVPTASVEDQEAGWLTGMKESDWLNLGVGAQKGLFPENFTQRLE
ncbi:hypothetical protein CHARACLAT_014663, partial [Characodon lateralis]|nr:hypothetical protein [Characodon lateralis]